MMQMAMIKQTLAIIAILSLYPMPGVAGPFGYEQGMSPEAVRKISKGIRRLGDALMVDQPPIVNEKFQAITLTFSKRSGLCFLHAIGKPFYLMGGSATKLEFEETVQALSSKYGKFSLAFEPHADVRESVAASNWYQAVTDQKGQLVAIWPEAQRQELPDRVRSVRLSVSVFELPTGIMGALHLSYWFSNYEDCSREGRAARSKGL